MQKKTAPPPVSDINVTPMVDVMLVLLIIFMVITPMLSKGTPVDLVQTKNPVEMPDQDKEDAVTVAVTRNGKLFLSPGNDPITADQIPQKVKSLLEASKQDKVYIRADQRARYETVEDVVDNLRAAGVDQIGLMTELMPQSQQTATPPPAKTGGM